MFCIRHKHRYVTGEEQVVKHTSKDKTISGDECMIWSEIFEEWPKAEIDNGSRTFEFLPNWETIGNMTFPGSLSNITYIRWEDNRSSDI